MQSTINPPQYHGNYKPPGWSLSEDAPLHNWRVVHRPGWAEGMQRNLWANALLSLLWHTQRIGLCGKAAPDGSDVWDRKRRER